MQKFYLTTAIPYANGLPHIGHASELIGADFVARGKRNLRYDVLFQTGLDEHGQKIADTAAQAHLSPSEHLSNISPKFEELWSALNISYDQYIKTTNITHKVVVAKVWSLLKSKGDIYLGKYDGLYCVPCEAFWSKSQAGQGNTCNTCQRELIHHSEEAYFFKLSSYYQQIKDYIESNQNFILPSSRRNEVIQSFLKEDLDDLCISRKNLSWGVPVPEDSSHVIYVWFDALLNYISGIGYTTDESNFRKWWEADLQFIGKDITKFHAVIWLALCFALNIAPPKKIYGHGFITNKDEKISKSSGNSIDVWQYLKLFGGDPEPLRYYFAKEISFAQDSNFSEENLVACYESDLVNGIGNLLARTVSMIEKYCDGKVVDNPLTCLTANYSTFIGYENHLNNFAFDEIVKIAKALAVEANGLITSTEPWKIYKENPSDIKINNTLYEVCNSLRIIALLLNPIIPNASIRILESLGLDSTSEWRELLGLRPKAYSVCNNGHLFSRLK